MFKLNLEMASAAHIAASRNQYRSFGTANALGLDLAFEAKLYPDPSQPLAIEVHVIKDGKPVEPFTTLTSRVRAYEMPLEGDEVIVPVHDNEFLRAPLFDAGLFCDSSKRVPLHFGEAEVWKILPKFVEAFCGAYPKFKPLPAAFLPPWCFAIHPSPERQTEIIRIDRGEPGYRMVSKCLDDDETISMLGLMNDQTHATDLEVEAMLNGSLFGWETPGADPKHLARLRAKRTS